MIDFEWGGDIGVATYPFYMNHQELQWPEGAKDGDLITREHDRYWLSSLSTTTTPSEA